MPTQITPVLPDRPGLAVTPAAPTYRIGDYTVTRVTERVIDSFAPSFLLPTAAPETVARHLHWMVPACADEGSEHLRLSIHTWVLRRPGRTILIDTCIGNFKERPGKAVFHQLDTPYLLRLKAAGVDPADVDLVLNTHLHTDHVGWNTQLVDGRWLPTFPNARYLFPQLELELVREHPGHLRQVFEDSVKPVIDSGQASTVLPEGESIGDGLRFVPTNGHTAGHMSIWLESGEDCALFSGDVMHHPLQVHEPYLNSVFCDFPDLAARTRTDVLNQVADRRAHYFSSHFPASSVGKVERQGAGFAWRFI
ncbi:MAG: MBL fold metallo-hydrolase [Burkholderiaceae bacterium]